MHYLDLHQDIDFYAKQTDNNNCIYISYEAGSPDNRLRFTLASMSKDDAAKLADAIRQAIKIGERPGWYKADELERVGA